MDDEEEEVFVVKKSTGNKPFKKMRQAPTASTVMEVEKTAPAYPSFGSSYSSETLEQLRNNQKFVMKTSIEMEGIELSGDAAEQFVAITESLSKDSITVDTVPDDFDGSADFIAFHKGQKESKMLLKGKSDNRMYTQVKEHKEVFDMGDENDEDWEAEVMRRGAINSAALSGSKLSSAGVVNKSHTRDDLAHMKLGTSDNLMGRGSETVTVEDTVRLIQVALERLRANGETLQSRRNQLQLDGLKSREAAEKLRSRLDGEVAKLNVAQETRLFLAALVGMLRAKQGLVKELRAAAIATLKAQREGQRRWRAEEQEDMLLRVKEVRLLYYFISTLD